jgi:hypothetical protein
MAKAIDTGLIVNELKRTTMTDGNDQIVDQEASASVNVGLAIVPEYMIAQPIMGTAIENTVKYLVPSLESQIRLLGIPKMYDYKVPTQTLLKMLEQAQLTAPSLGIGMLSAHEFKTYKRSRGADNEENIAKTALTEQKIAAMKHDVFLMYRSPTTVYNRLVRHYATTALEALAKAWTDKEHLDYQEARLAKFRKKLGADELAVQIKKKEARYIHANQLFTYYMQQYRLTDRALKQLGAALRAIDDRDVLDAATVLYIDRQIAANALFDLVPTILEMATEPVIFRRNECQSLTIIARSKSILQAIQLLEPYIRQDFTKEPLGSIAWLKSAADYWSATLKLGYMRVHYHMGQETIAKPEESIKAYAEHGLPWAIGVLEGKTGLKIGADVLAIAKEFARTTTTLEINGDKLEQILTAGVLRKAGPMQRLWTTEAPGQAARKLVVPHWDIITGLGLDGSEEDDLARMMKSNEAWQAFFITAFEAVKLTNSKRFLGSFESEGLFKGLPLGILLESESIKPIMIGEIRSDRSILLTDKSVAVEGVPIVPTRYATDMSYSVQRGEPEHQLDLNML